jgi:diacylglycerol kinase (ATP)
LLEAVDTLRHEGTDVQVLPTTGPGTASAIARDCIERGAGLILAAGGDGTINEIVNGMAHSGVPLGILPAGTANVLATEMGINRGMQRAARALTRCVPERVSLGLLRNEAEPQGRYFLLMAGIGLDAHIVYSLSAPLKARFGKIAYWIAGFSQLGRRFPEFTVECEGSSFNASLALASRVRNYGGDLEIAPTISLLEDQFEVVLFSGSSSFRYLKYMLGIVARRQHRMSGVTILRTRRLSCSQPETNAAVHVQLDGEYAGLLPAEMEIAPAALTLLVPPEFRSRRPLTIQDPAWTTSPTR